MNVIITGTSRGLGLEFCRQALKNEASVLAVCRHPQKAKGLLELKVQYGKTLQLLEADVSASETPAKIFAAAIPMGHVDVLINNAGTFVNGEGIEDFVQSFRVNSIAPFLISQALLGLLKKSASPKLIQISSLMGSIGDNSSGGSHAYRTSKAALNMFNKCLAIENPWLAASVLHPGWAKTDMGGVNASVTIADSVSGLWSVIDGLTTKDSGGFFDYLGRPLSW